ncbi:restriction endonuclease subunit S [Mariniluteicoccus flavus]
MTPGAIWHGPLPIGWESAPLKAMARLRPGATPDSSNEAFWCEPEDGLPWVAIADMSGRDAVCETVKGVTREGQEEKGLSPGRPGTLLFAMYASVGEVARLAIPATWNQAILGLTPYTERSVSRYLQYALMAIRPHLAFDFRSNTQNNLNAWQVAHLRMPCPPVSVQQTIADFLDRETAQIDAMIEAQMRLIEDLESRQIAVIRHLTEAERNGWPEGRVKHVGNVTLGKMLASKPSSTADTEQKYLRAANIQPLGALDLTDLKSMWFTPAEVNRLDLREGDVLVVEGGQGGFGRAAYLPRSLPSTGFQNSINRVRMHTGNLGRFLSYSLIAARAAGLMHAMCPAVSMPHMTAEKLAAFPVATPPPAEQRFAVSRIDVAMQQTGRTIAAARAVVKLLRERRAAVINAAVTGKIDPKTGVERIDPTTQREAS